MVAVAKQRGLEQPVAQLALYDPDAELEQRYDRWFAKTSCPIAAAILATAMGQASLISVVRQLQSPAQQPTDSLSIEQVAKRLAVSRGVIYRLCKDGVMPHTKVGRRITITPEQIAEYQNRQPQELSTLRYV
jgi:excisionase family DNA binding protein